MTTEKPMLFSGEMVRAILHGTKTQTRRVVKFKPFAAEQIAKTVLVKEYPNGFFFQDKDGNGYKCGHDHGTVGDNIWVKETFQKCIECGRYDYAADVNRPKNCRSCDATLGNWKPSIFCSRDASRITLEIVSVRVERLNDISEADAVAEGIKRGMDAIASYSTLWTAINGRESWAANPFVWAIEFKRIKP